MAVIGIDLGGTKIAAALFDQNGTVMARKTELLAGRTGDQVGDLINDVIASFRMAYLTEIIQGIGVCVPGIVYSRTDRVWAPNIPGWEDYPLKAKIMAGLDGVKLPVSIESDRTCYILGEVWQGAARGCENAIYLAVGTGIGAGILLDGRVIHGANDIVGATGWMALEHPYQEEFVPVGCFEYYASGNGIGTNARRLLMQQGDYAGVLRNKPIEAITSHDVFDAYASGDLLATQVLDKAVQMWGMGTANLVSLFNPEKIIFGGGVFGPAVGLIDRIYQEACRWGQPISIKQVEFCASKVGGDAALLGAAYLILRSLRHV
ncbi:MAG: ROK family protein [Bacteroidales bacterium]|nr:ROK family protein [Bacteroidales bacterium]